MNHKSPLLSLPQEIKDKIYEQILGSRTIKMTKKGVYPYMYVLDVFEEEAEKAVYEAEALVKGRAIVEPSRFFDSQRPKNPPKQELDLQFLQTCRQIYTEAKNVPFNSNTFSIISACYGLYFLRRLPRPTELRNVRLHIKVLRPAADNFVERLWVEVLVYFLCASGLKGLHIHLEQYRDNRLRSFLQVQGIRVYLGQYPDQEELFTDAMKDADFMMKLLGSFSRFDLKTVTVVISDRCEKDGMLGFKWAKVEKQMRAGKLTTILVRKDSG